MFPTQTSFIPVSVALARYVEAHGFGGNFPFWYLGTTPVKYLTGPVIPAILVSLHKIFPNLSFFDLSYFIIVTSYFIHAAGWGLLAAKLSADKKVGWLVGVLMLIVPFHIFWNLAFGEVSAIMVAALTPWVLWAFISSFVSVKKRSANLDSESKETSPPRSSLRQQQISDDARTIKRSWLRHVFDQFQNFLIPSVAFGFLFLINTTASVPAMIGLAVLGVISYKRWEEGLRSAAVVVIVGLILILWWYSPAYWLTIAGASSIGGRSAFGAFMWILNTLRSLVPILLALAVVLWGFKPKGQYFKFAVAWTAVFGLLTLLRFSANPEFWLDWTAWVGEVEVGIVLLIAKYVSSIKYFVLRDKLKILAFCLLLVTSYFFAFQNREYWLPRGDISQTVEYKIAEWLSNNLTIEPASPSLPDSESIGAKRGEQSNNSSTVFLSGTTVFWLNSLADIRQVRGGRDEVSVDNNWRKAVWEIRQGSDPQQLEGAISKLGISYLVVHSENSNEFYHDFENVERFNQIKSLQKVYDRHGDFIYKVFYHK